MKYMHFFVYLYVVLCTLHWQSLYAQDSIRIDTSYVTPVDTMSVYVMHLSDLSQAYIYADTTLDNYFYSIDRAIGLPFEYENTGNAGSSSRSLLYDALPYVGYNRGFRQYRAYNYTPENYRIFSSHQAFSHASFSPRGGKNDFIVDAKFSQRFKNNIGISLSYDRIAQTGLYQGQATKLSNFGFSVYHLPKHKRYNAILSILSNVSDEAHNGGVRPEVNFLLPESRTKTYLDVVLSDASSRFQEKWIDFRHSYKLKGWAQAYHDARYGWMYYKYSDSSVDRATDSAYYGQYLTDKRGVRMLYKESTLSNKLGVRLHGQSLQSDVGIRYAYIQATNEYHAKPYHDFQTHAHVKWTPYAAISFYGTGELGMLDAAGSYKTEVGSSLVSKWAVGRLAYTIHSTQQSFVDRFMAVSGQEVYSHNFKNTHSHTTAAAVSFPGLGIGLGYKRYNLKNSIYVDSFSTPQQLGRALNINQWTASWKWKWKGLSFENHAFLQQFSEDIYRIPPWYIKSDLAYSFYMFDKALRARVGVSGSYIPSRGMASYMPLTGAFYQTLRTSGERKKLDVYVSAKIQTMRMFVTVDNVLSYIDRQPIVQVYRHPMHDAYIRMGLSWLFRN